ncbi:purine-nucleoside phosphorylase [Allorhodopirellula heiligendammensis]|uniref:Purine nucleoside phosphorylase n=1 Tax=Allorhodopirellula heiligendammensis TaxID=2714739 RepID=A0A5C6BY70_9BACT|nr:purine-nucleoside phosphorylase [Allorhodopirellula heiligendammensis]TWU16752.1 Purine nucleoside phosphorylase 1 [Allorhodopirellula heiligendammensis]
MAKSSPLAVSKPSSSSGGVSAMVDCVRKQAAGWFADSETPLLAVILGSGLGGLADSIDVAAKIGFDQLPGMPVATALGHRGEFLLGRFAGVRVIAMAGRLHAYEGHDIHAISRGMALLASLSVDAVIISCAAGGLNSRYQTGDLVIIDEHIGLLHGQMGMAALCQQDTVRGAPSGLRCGRPTCDPEFADIVYQVCSAEGAAGRIHRGTYLAVSGPNYETRAECRMMKSWGADIVGMSTVPEVVLSSRAGLRTIAIGVVTNMAVPDAPMTASHEDVLAVSSRASERLQRIVGAIAASLSRYPLHHGQPQHVGNGFA